MCQLPCPMQYFIAVQYPFFLRNHHMRLSVTSFRLSSFRWMSVGEFAVLLLWVGAMISHLWQGVYRSMEKYHDGTGPCPGDPTSKCYLDSEDEPEPAESTAQKRYGMP